IMLELKGIDYTHAVHDLRAGQQHDPAYLAIAPHGLVPAVEHAGEILIESPAIIEWIETRWPEPRLLPASPEGCGQGPQYRRPDCLRHPSAQQSACPHTVARTVRCRQQAGPA